MLPSVGSGKRFRPAPFSPTERPPSRFRHRGYFWPSRNRVRGGGGHLDRGSRRSPPALGSARKNPIPPFPCLSAGWAPLPLPHGSATPGLPEQKFFERDRRALFHPSCPWAVRRPVRHPGPLAGTLRIACPAEAPKDQHRCLGVAGPSKPPRSVRARPIIAPGPPGPTRRKAERKGRIGRQGLAPPTTDGDRCERRGCRWRTQLRIAQSKVHPRRRGSRKGRPLGGRCRPCRPDSPAANVRLMRPGPPSQAGAWMYRKIMRSDAMKNKPRCVAPPTTSAIAGGRAGPIGVVSRLGRVSADAGKRQSAPATAQPPAGRGSRFPSRKPCVGSPCGRPACRRFTRQALRGGLAGLAGQVPPMPRAGSPCIGGPWGCRSSG